MSDFEERFHKTWLGMVQPIEGLVLSLPVLVGAELSARRPAAFQARFRELCPEVQRSSREESVRAIQELDVFLGEVLGLEPAQFDRGPALPEALSLWVPEGRSRLRPTLALRRPDPGPRAEEEARAIELETPARRAGLGYELLVLDLPPGLPLDRPDARDGEWVYPPTAKFDRLLRACGVPIGLLTNREVIRLVYAPHGEQSGAITFRVDAMATSTGRPILDAFAALLSGPALFTGPKERRLPALLRASRTRQAEVTEELAQQLFEAMEIWVEGFQAAAERDGGERLDEALAHHHAFLYQGLLTVLLRLVFLLYAEERGLLPLENAFYARHLSVLGLFDDLERDAAAYPDSMSRRFGAWPRLIALFRALFLGAEHDGLSLPPRNGGLFSPHEYPFLEGWALGGSSPLHAAEDRSAVRVPSIDDETVHHVLDKLIRLRGQRLAYGALEVEQIGSVYEALMGYQILKAPSAGVAVRGKHDQHWLFASELLALPAGRRGAHVEEVTGLSGKTVKKAADALKAAKSEADVLAALEPLSARKRPRVAKGRLVIQPGTERQRTSAHYTPPALSEPIVRRTLEPLFSTMGPNPSSARILNLKVCDPAMGSGAFLVAACRYLAERLVEAWTREGKYAEYHAIHGDALLEARRQVAQRCLYGVDRNPYAVQLAKLSLWLETMAKDEPFSFLDHALRHGDSLVGLSLEQIGAFHWNPKAQLAFVEKTVREELEEALARRLRILELAFQRGAGAHKEKTRELGYANDAVDRVRLIGDVILGAFFSSEKDKEREAELRRRRALVDVWLEGNTPPSEELLAMQRELRAITPAFHWEVEFPSVFYEARPDPLEKDEAPQVAWMDAFVGNPPFMGKNGVSAMGGPSYLDWLKQTHPGSHGNADYSAHFFRRSFHLLGHHGTLGLLATNTLGQGDTRATGLQFLLAPKQEGLIYEATRSRPWPGDASVAVSVVHMAKGNVRDAVRGACVLDGRPAEAVNSRLRAKGERADPVALKANQGLSYVGSYVLGMGFTLTPDERDALLKRSRKNGERIFPYLGGEEVNTSPTQDFDRYVISFGDMSLEEAERWPDLIEIVREKVKPERDKNNRATYRNNWWQFGEKRPELHQALKPLSRCLVNSRHSKHLIFAWQPADRVFSEALYVYPFEDNARFACLQSRVHEPWARLLSSSMRTDLRYAASDCFETFPFPRREKLSPSSRLETVGARLDAARSAYMRESNQGLTATYNQLKDPECQLLPIVALRKLHCELDRAVLEAYGWSDVEVPHYQAPRTEAERARLEAFEDEVIDRLFALNQERAEEEALGGPAEGHKEARPRAAALERSLPATKKSAPRPAPPKPGQRTKGAGTKRAAAAKTRTTTKTTTKSKKEP